jgi:transposase
MPNSRPPYAPEYRRRIVELARAGRSPQQLARDFEPTETCIRNWIKQADLDAGRRNDGLTSEERAELTQLRREVRIRDLVVAHASAVLAVDITRAALCAAPGGAPDWNRWRLARAARRAASRRRRRRRQSG